MNSIYNITRKKLEAYFESINDKKYRAHLKSKSIELLKYMNGFIEVKLNHLMK